MSRLSVSLLAALAATACYPTTTRPAFMPESAAPVTELQLGIPQATRAVALQLDADSIPVRRTEPKDGWLESDWFDARTLRPTAARRLGPDVVKVRAWIDPSRPDYSNVTVETVYRPIADPSRAPRQLERQVSDSTPLAARIRTALQQLSKQYGGVPADTVKPAADSGVKRRLKRLLPVDTSAGVPRKPERARR